MKKSRRYLFQKIGLAGGLLAYLLLPLNGQAQETGFTYLQRELAYLVHIWPGDFDNQEQVSFDARATTESNQEAARFHARIDHLVNSAIGEHVLYLQETQDDNPDSVHRQQIYVLLADEDKKAIRIKSYAIKGNSLDKRSKAKLSSADLNYLEGCDILLRRDGTSFAGALEATRCDDGLNAGLLERQIRISADQYSFNDRRVGEDGKEISSIAEFTPRRLIRARWFACMVDVPKDIPNRSNHTQHYIKIHDQGGTFTFTHPDGRQMVLVMRNTWSYGMQRKTFFIGVFEDTADGKLLVYSWGPPGADRIGMNPGYVRIQCDLDSERNVKLQKQLRVES